MKRLNKGFTLIELLVVIAIIGILATIVLAALGDARRRGVDASLKGEFSSLRAQVEIFSNGAGYAGVFGADDADCDSPDTGITSIFTDVLSHTADCQASSAATGWAAQGQLTDDTSIYFCVDSTGTAKETTGASDISDQVCD